MALLSYVSECSYTVSLRAVRLAATYRPFIEPRGNTNICIRCYATSPWRSEGVLNKSGPSSRITVGRHIVAAYTFKKVRNTYPVAARS